MKYWEIIANKIIKAGFSVGWVSALDDYGRTVWIVDAHRKGTRFVVRADEQLTAFLELESACLYPPIERTMLTIIATMAASITLCVVTKAREWLARTAVN